MTRNEPKHRFDPPGPFLARSWSAGAPRRQRRSCSLRCACSTLTPPTHRQGSPGSRNDPPRPGVTTRKSSTTHPPQAAGPGRRGGGRARNDLRLTYEQQWDSQPPAPRSTLRPAEAFQPNSPSCGNQPANISLTAPSSTDTHANSSTLGPATRSGAREAIRAPLHHAPLTRRHYISDERRRLLVCQEGRGR